MSENATSNGTAMPVLQPWLDFWTRNAEQSKEYLEVMLGAMKGAPDLQALRRRWLDSLAQSLDAFMRTPAFLQAMRQNFELVTEVKANTEEVAQEAARAAGVPRLSDISGLFERLRLAQDIVLDRLSAIEHRLEAIEEGLGKRV